MKRRVVVEEVSEVTVESVNPSLTHHIVLEPASLEYENVRMSTGTGGITIGQLDIGSSSDDKSVSNDSHDVFTSIKAHFMSYMLLLMAICFVAWRFTRTWFRDTQDTREGRHRGKKKIREKQYHVGHSSLQSLASKALRWSSRVALQGDILRSGTPDVFLSTRAAGLTESLLRQAAAVAAQKTDQGQGIQGDSLATFSTVPREDADKLLLEAFQVC